MRDIFSRPYSKISFDLEPFKDVINYNTNIEFSDGEFVDFDFFLKVEFEQSNQGGARFAVSNDLSLKLKYRR